MVSFFLAKIEDSLIKGLFKILPKLVYIRLSGLVSDMVRLVDYGFSILDAVFSFYLIRLKNLDYNLTFVVVSHSVSSVFIIF